MLENKYLITIEKVQVTRMVVSEKNKKKAISKVRNLMDSVNDQIIDSTFDTKSFFRYKANKIKK